MMSVLDASIANVALPTIGRELRADPAASIWVVNAFQIAVTVTLLPLAALGDAIGYRKLFSRGIILFTAGSLACALSHSLGALVAARVLQGFGASAIMSVGPALYRTIFPSAKLGQALGISAFVVASSASAGPTIGGAILAVLPWPWLFALNVPIGIADALLAPRALPRRTGRGGRVDIVSALLSAGALGLFVLGLDGFAHPVPRWQIAALLAAAFAFGAAFIERQRRVSNPVLPLDLFGSSRFSLATATSFCSFVAQGLAYVSLPFLFQEVLGFSPLASGLLFTPWPIAIALMAPIAGALADRYPPQALATAGLTVFACGLEAMALLPSHAGVANIVWRAVLCGIGFGFFQSPNNREIMGSVPRERSGSASGVLATVRVTGQTVGAALVAIALGTAGATLVAHAANATLTASAHAAIARSVHATLAFAGAAAAAAAAVSALRLRKSGP
jgi:DHA2 family multidrug resistance protein-like MFS transporter